MRVHFSQHFLRRAKARQFSTDDAKKIYYRPEHKFFDNDPDNMSNISVRRLQYGGSLRLILLAFAYDRGNKRVIIKTIHPITSDQMNNRIKVGRWTPR